MTRAEGRGWLDWSVLGIALAVCLIALEAEKPPAARPADAPAAEFSAARAMEHVEAIARAPHPTGTPEAERVRGVVARRLGELGLATEIQVPKDARSPVRNVVARLKGQGPSGKKALLLCAHYDSVPYGPGAGDNASGVAVVLETFRAIRAGTPLERDVIALIDDGEEVGLLGARLFVDEHAWAKDVGVVLNFDARGVSGPSFMFETSDRNGWLIRQFALASPRPLATSVSMDVLRIMPNSSDMTVFKRAGLAGLNFAFIGGSENYHRDSDSPANLDRRSVQHHGDNALALTRHLGRLDLDDPWGDDVVYTSVLSRMVLSYPRSWAMPIALATVALWVVVTGIGLVSRRVTVLDLGLSLLIWPVATVVSVFCVQAFWIVLRDIPGNLGIDLKAFELPILTVCSAIAATVTVTVIRRVVRRRSIEALALGALAWWMVLAGGSAHWVPGASYLFAWPAFFALIGLGGMIWVRPGSAWGSVWILMGAMPALVVLPPVIRDMFDALGLRMAGLLMVTIVLFLGVIMPVLTPLVVESRRGIDGDERRDSGPMPRAL